MAFHLPVRRDMKTVALAFTLVITLAAAGAQDPSSVPPDETQPADANINDRYVLASVTRGDPESPLRWTSKSTRRLAAELRADDHPVSQMPTRGARKERPIRAAVNAGEPVSELCRRRAPQGDATIFAAFPMEMHAGAFISTNWRGEPLYDYETIVRLIANTTTAKGLTVTCRLDRRRYPVGRKVSDKEMATLNLTRHSFHGERNYVINPRGNV